MKFLALAALFLFAGCIMPDQVDQGNWQHDGLFGAWNSFDEQFNAREDPDGVPYPKLPFTAAELDADWGAGTYALTDIEYTPAGEWNQGFYLSSYQVQGLWENPSNERALYDEFLQAITLLTPEERAAHVDALFDPDHTLVETAPLPDKLAISLAWDGTGTVEKYELGFVRIHQGAWTYHFSLAVKSAESTSEQLRVDAAGFAEYRWYSNDAHTDAQSMARLAGYLDRHDVPQATNVSWTHGAIEYD